MPAVRGRGTNFNRGRTQPDPLHNVSSHAPSALNLIYIDNYLAIRHVITSLRFDVHCPYGSLASLPPIARSGVHGLLKQSPMESGVSIWLPTAQLICHISPPVLLQSYVLLSVFHSSLAPILKIDARSVYSSLVSGGFEETLHSSAGFFFIFPLCII